MTTPSPDDPKAIAREALSELQNLCRVLDPKHHDASRRQVYERTLYDAETRQSLKAVARAMEEDVEDSERPEAFKRVLYSVSRLIRTRLGE